MKYVNLSDTLAENSPLIPISNESDEKDDSINKFLNNR